eukprot:gene21435-25778_t
MRWTAQELSTAGLRGGWRLEYIPGRDTLHSPSELRQGVDAYDAHSGEHVLSTFRVVYNQDFLRRLEPFVARLLQFHKEGKLPECCDGRISNGMVDVRAYLGEPAIHARMEQAAHKRRRTMDGDEDGGQARRRGLTLLEKLQVVHIHPSGRSVFIGDVAERSSSGGNLRVDCGKAWKSHAMNSWSGGMKMADVCGSRPK